MGAGYVWLDHAHIEQGLALAPDGDFLALFSHGFAGTGYYRPLVSLSLSLDAAPKAGAWLFHVTTLAWHVVASTLCLWAALELGLSRRAAAGAALLFAVHPVTSLVASAIAFRSESMCATFLFGLIVLHLRGKPWAGALLALGALTKETALVLGPLFVVALELWPPDGATRRTLQQRLLLLGAETVGLAFALGLRAAFAPSWRAELPNFTASEAVGTRSASLAKSALAVVLPFDRTVCDTFTITRSWEPAALAGLVLAGGLAYLAYRRRGPALLLLLALLPSLQLVPVTRWWSPHYLYVPLAFTAMLTAEALERRGKQAFRFLLPAALGLGGLTLIDGRRYHDDPTLWGLEARAEPGCREAHFYLGEVARKRGELEAAGTAYERALTEAPRQLSYVDRPATLQNLGVVRAEQGRFEEATAAFVAALKTTEDPQARHDLRLNLARAAKRLPPADRR